MSPLSSIVPALFTISFTIFSSSGKLRAQNQLDDYLSKHRYTIDLLNDQPKELDELLASRLSGYKAVLLGEGGSHYLEFYFPLRLFLLRSLNRTLGVRSFVMEYGSSLSVLYNKYLSTGDSSYLPAFRDPNALTFLRSLYHYNQAPGVQPIRTIGIDFESPIYYFKALRALLPKDPPPLELQNEIEIIKQSSDSSDCNDFVKTDRRLKESLRTHEATYRQYFKGNFDDVFRIISNEGSCKDVLKNRNTNLKARFELFDSYDHDLLYYGELGEAHVNFTLKNLSYRLNNDKRSPFAGKVAVLNVYCYNCTTPHEAVSNWTMNKIEGDIRNTFLKYCDSDYTLFDLTQSDAPAITRFRAYGQFLLIVKNQH